MPRTERKRKQRQNKPYEAAKGSGSITRWLTKSTDGEQVRATPQQQHCAASENNSMASDPTSTENPATSSANENFAGQVKTDSDDKENTLGQKDCHSFYYRIDKKVKEHSVTCTKRCTVLEALQTDQPFKSFFERNRKEGRSVVIERDNRFLATHFPCWLFNDEETVLIKSFPGETDEVSDGYVTIKDDDIITFYISSIGGLNMRRMSFLRNPKLQKRKALCIYGYIGETVEDALKRDGRFIDEVFQGSISLCKEGEEKEYYLNTVISRVFKERSLQLQKTAQRQAESKTANDTTKSESARKSDPCSNSGNPSTSSAPGGSKPSSDKAMADKGPDLHKKVHEIPDSTEILEILREQFQGLLEQMKERHKKSRVKDVVELLREEFGKNIQSFSEVGTVKNLMDMSASVCYIEVQKETSGTGFLLFDRYILTNAHIIKAFTHNRVLKRKVTATFAFESSTSKYNKVWPIKKEVVAEMYSNDEFKRWMDFALLELDQQEKDKMLPPALLSAFEPLPEEGGICLIGHPEGEQKRMDPTFIFTVKQRFNALDAHFSEGGNRLQYNPQSQSFTYQTCFYHGSSGSPIFSTTCQLVAMHTGSYCWNTIKGKQCYVLEFGISMSSVLDNLLLQMMKNRQIELLSKFIGEAMKSKSTIQVVAEFIWHMLQMWKEDLDSVLLTVITTAKDCGESSELRTSLCEIIPSDYLQTLMHNHSSSKSLSELSELLKEEETPMETDQQTAGN